MKKNYKTKNLKETQKIGEDFAKEILALPVKKSAFIIALYGDLGAGKTTFMQGFAKGLGIKEKILSPTYVIQKRFEIKNKNFRNFYHIDCYRLKNYKDVLELGWKEIIKNPENIVAVEWPEKIKKALSQSAIKIHFKFINEKIRKLTIKK